MPNWCRNVVTISKNGADYEAIAKRIKTEGLYGQFIPAPKDMNSEELLTTCINNWGVKWDANEAYIVIDNNRMLLDFDSPWNPPTRWIEHMATLGYDISGAYWEENMQIGGTYKTENATIQWTTEDMVTPGTEIYYDLILHGLIYVEDEI